MKLLRLATRFLAVNLSAQLAYRPNFLASVMGTLLEAAVSLTSLGILFEQTEVPNIGGWTYHQALLVTGFYLLTLGLINVWIEPNMGALSAQIRGGSFDFVLLKPVDAQLYTSIRQTDLLRLPEVLVGLGVLAYASAHVGVNSAGIALAAALYTCALALVYGTYLGLSTSAFWWVRTKNITQLFVGVFGAGRFPVSSFTAPVRLLLTVAMPVAFITTIPAEALLGRLSGLMWAAPALACSALVATRWLWLRALATYTSASS